MKARSAIRQAVFLGAATAAILGLLDAAGLLAPPSAGTSPAKVGVGINLGGSDTRTLEAGTPAEQAATFTAMVASGITRIRVDVSFDTSEPRPGVFDWHQTSYIRRAVAAHLQVDALLDYPPKWSSQADGSTSPTAFASFAGAAAAHFAPLGVRLYEILNEPNRYRVGGRRVDPADYAALLRMTYPRIKAVDPGLTVLVGGLANGADAPDGTTVSMTTYIEDLYAHGAGRSFDGIALHPDSAPVLPMFPAAWNNFYHLPRIHQVLVAHGDGAKKLWLTEYGAPTSGSKDAVSYSNQAKAIEAAYMQAKAWGWIAAIFYFDWQDEAQDGAWGLSTSSGQPKPALNVLRRMLGRPQSTAAVPVA